MDLKTIELGTPPLGTDGDTAREAFTKVNENFSNLDNRVSSSEADISELSGRSITAGVGLEGGGDLSEDRTLSVRFGDAEGTAAEGNDDRLSNSREWSAETVSQPEAEAGTATTRRAWTAQRVRQAITAWWNQLGTSFGRGFIALADAAAGRTKLGLGTAATRDVTTSQYDNTVNRVMRVGDFGFGGRAPVNSYISGYPQSVEQNFGQIYRRESDDNGVAPHSTSIHFAALDTWGRLRIRHAGKMAWVEGGNASNGSGWTAKLVLDSDVGTAASKDVGVSPGDVMEVGAFGLGSRGAILTPSESLGDREAKCEFLYWGAIPSDISKGEPNAAAIYMRGNVDRRHAIYVDNSGRLFTWTKLTAETNPVSRALLDDTMVSQTTGQSTTAVMSQKAVTDALGSGGGIGAGQDWQDVRGSRAVGTTYTNTTGKPIFVSVWTSNQPQNGHVYAEVDGLRVAYLHGDGGGPGVTTKAVTFIVPNGKTYVVRTGGENPGEIAGWVEMR